MINKKYIEQLQSEIANLKNDGLYKNEYQIISSQSAEIEVKIGSGTRKMLNFCANNYLGLANDPRLTETAKEYLDKYGFGTASVRFICGTMDVNREFEYRIAKFLGYEDAISFASCFQANNGIFQALLSEEDAIITANLNHASLIDGIRLSKAKRFFYKFDDMADLEAKIKDSAGSKKRLIVTDGGFSMDGDVADLKGICDLAEKYDCMVMVDDCHATGFLGVNGRGTAEYCGVEGRVDILSSTIGKALGGASGGFIASKKEIIDILRNKHRGYLFSNNLTPATAAVSIKVVEILEKSKDLIQKLQNNTAYFRGELKKAGLTIRDGFHPVVPVMFGDAKLAAKIAKDMVEEMGVYVIAFAYPVVPHGEARIRVQISSAHEKHHLDRAVEAFRIVSERYR